MADFDDSAIDWSLTTWEGSRREQLRRWAQLSLEEILLAQEEMSEFSECFSGAAGQNGTDSRS